MVSDERLISALLSTGTVKEAAQVAGCAESTLYARKREPAFMEKLKREKSALLERAALNAQSRIEAAITVVVEVMSDTQNGAQVRLNAADTLLRHAVRLTEVADITARLTALESIFGGGRGP